MTNEIQKKNKKNGALLIAAGIFLSRIFGLLRERAFAHYFGNSDAGDAYKAALKIPNFLQNLFGEGVLSASFIPVYAKLLSDGDENEAKSVAHTIFTLLLLMTSLLVLLGVISTPFLIDTIAPGFSGEKRELTIKLVQIFFPGTGLLVMSAWCLGILNSHRYFFLSYVAPVLWNLAIICTLIFYGPQLSQNDLALKAAWGLVLGSFLQFAIQIPKILSLTGKLKFELKTKLKSVQTILTNVVPVIFSRGVVQVSAYIDNVMASLLPTGAVSALAYAQTIYLLPVSLFGMSISAAELPELSSAKGTEDEIKSFLITRLNRALSQLSFYIIPTLCAFICLGELIVSVLFKSGAFDDHAVLLVWVVLAGSTVGLLASTKGRLYSSAFYALKDTKTPLRFAMIRVLFTSILGYIAAFKLVPLLGLDPIWGTAALTITFGNAAQIEYYLLRRKLNQIIGATGANTKYLAQLWAISILSSLIGLLCKFSLKSIHLHLLFKTIIIFGVFGVAFLILAHFLKLEESKRFTKFLGLK